MKISRRTFLRRAFLATATVGVGSSLYPTFIEPRRVEINHLRLAIRGMPRAFDGLTIAQLSDLHRSQVVSAAYLNHCIDLANGLQPDLILLTGDYLTESPPGSRHGGPTPASRVESEKFASDCARSLARARAKHGVFASLGNHDHWFDADFVARQIQDVGITVLRNQHAEVRVNGEALPIVGLGDLWTEGADVSLAFAGVDAPFALVLMHNPDSFENWSREGAHLILSGHTHGGQVNIPFYGPPIVPSRYGMKYAHGLFQRGDTQMYVNRGLGLIAPPVRFNCRPEISIFHLQSA